MEREPRVARARDPGWEYTDSHPMPILTLLTDFGLADYYVGAVKGTVLRLAPGIPLTLIDLSHEVPPGDIATASHLLRAASPTFPDGTVHLAVVDPGVGSGRRILAAEAAGALYVAPDNGLLTPIFDHVREPGPGPRIHAVTRADLFLPAPGQTFHGRDRFAPTAAYLLRGEPLADLGPEIEDPVRIERPAARREGSKLTGQIIHIDHYGNLVTDIPSEWLPADRAFTVSLGAHSSSRRVDHYRQLDTGEAGVLPGSQGTLELSLDSESLAERWRVERGQTVVLRLAAEARS